MIFLCLSYLINCGNECEKTTMLNTIKKNLSSPVLLKQRKQQIYFNYILLLSLRNWNHSRRRKDSPSCVLSSARVTSLGWFWPLFDSFENQSLQQRDEGTHSPEASQTSQVFEECYQINSQTDGIKGPGAHVSVCTDCCDSQKMYMEIRWQVPQLKFTEHCHMFVYCMCR